ncbi:MAG: lipoate--protein ligase family protein [Planctomycetales bacterium]|nr:lipoate--protein ligase family protein [Planctomycetales bacterium]
MTPTARPCRLLLDPPANGAWNMAVDEVLLATAAESGQPTLRLYAWAEPTLSLGYFQAYQDRAQHAASRDCSLVRRMTGGGAIVHDRELTYSLCWPAAATLRRIDFGWLYDLVHETLQESLATQGIPLQPVGCPAPPSLPPAFLCFQRRGPHDLVLGAAKIVGSAQRRRQSAVLQHGSILLETSPAAPEVSGLDPRPGHHHLAATLRQSWPTLLAQRLDVDLLPARLTDRETRQASELVRIKYASPAWSHRR